MACEIKIKDNKIFAPLKDKWLVKTPEEEVRQNYICNLVNNYGYSLEQMKQELTVAEGNKRGTGRASADIVIWKNKEEVENKNPIIVVECKAENITIQSDDYWQGFHYARYCSSPFLVTTNNKQTKVFKVNTEYPKSLGDEIIDIPDASIIDNKKKITELLKQTKAFTRDEFSKVLFQCHNIIRNNDKLSPEAAFDEISKALFIKIRYERDNSQAQIFSKKRFEELKKSYDETKSKTSLPFYQQLFERTKEDFIDDELFSETETLRIRENSFEAIVEKLEKYNLSTTSDDVKGIAFEKFLGKTFRGELGQFFTPRTVVDFMVEILDPQESEIICDPACGSGGFLIKAFEYVRSKIEADIQKQKEIIRTKYYNEEYDKMPDKQKAIVQKQVDELLQKLEKELDINNTKSRIRELSYDCIFGIDANPRMSRTAKMNMIMHGDGHGGVHHNDGLLNVNGIFDGRFDIILTNPPFGSRVEKSLKVTALDLPSDEKLKKYKARYNNYEKIVVEPLKEWVNYTNKKDNTKGKPILDLFEVGKMSSLTEVLFIERCLNLLKPGGRMGIVLPEGVLNNSNLQKIRDFVESKAKIILITSIPQDVFIASGATVKPSLLFFKKFTEEEAKQYANITKKATDAINKKYTPIINKEKEKLILADEKYKKLAKKLKDINIIKGRKKGNIKIDREEYSQLKKSVLAAKENISKEKKLFKAFEKQTKVKIEAEIKANVKIDFDYQIPIAEVEKAGISTTGAQIENELKPLAKEFTKYREDNQLWQGKFDEIKYETLDDGTFYRIPIVNNIAKDPEIFYGK